MPTDDERTAGQPPAQAPDAVAPDAPSLTPEQVAARMLGSRGGRADTERQRAWRSGAKPGAGRPALPKIDRRDVSILRAEAIFRGEAARAAICERALSGSRRAWRQCQRWVQAARRKRDGKR